MTRPTTTRDYRPLMLLIALLIFVLDRWSKLTIEAHVRLGEHIPVIPKVFWISHVLNIGAAFSMFEGMNVRNALVGFSIVASIVVIVALWRVGRVISVTSIALSLILGGAVGNLYDRIKFSYVVDFLEVHIGSYHWPDFNLADSAIVTGACLLLLEMLRPQKASE